MNLTEEKLRHLQDITGLDAERSREALAWAQGDELEALAWLEQKGSIASAGLGFYSTAEEKTRETNGLAPVFRRREIQRVSDTPLGWGERIWLFLVGNRLVAVQRRNRNRRIECPLGVLLALLVIAWYAVIGVLVVGLVLGWRYRLEGPQLGKERVNAVLRQVQDWLRQKGQELRLWRKRY